MVDGGEEVDSHRFKRKPAAHMCREGERRLLRCREKPEASRGGRSRSAGGAEELSASRVFPAAAAEKLLHNVRLRPRQPAQQCIVRKRATSRASSLDPDALDLVEAQLVRGAVVELCRPGRLMGGDGLGDL